MSDDARFAIHDGAIQDVALRDVVVEHVPHDGRFVAYGSTAGSEGRTEVGYLAYLLEEHGTDGAGYGAARGGATAIMIATATEVPKQLENQGIASRLATAALDWARSQNYRVVPRCPFVRAFLERHTEYNGLVVADTAYGRESAGRTPTTSA